MTPGAADPTAPAAPTARGLKTRARLLEAGADVFTRKGFFAARVDDIVATARSSHGTFYLYFASKEELLDDLIAEVVAEMTVLIEHLPVVTNSAKGRAALRAWLGEFAVMYDRYGPVISTWTEAELSGELVGRRGDDLLGSLAAALTSNIAVPKRSGLDPTITTLALMTMVERFNYYAATKQVDADHDELLDTMVGIVSAAVFG